jgi:hypothetical protein
MKQSTVIWFFVLFVLFILLFRKKIDVATSKLSRGYRNRNPGNIRLTSMKWKGEIEGTDKSFKTFSTMAYGYRAIFALLREYITKGYDTIEKIISRYAPPVENVTSSYIADVERRTGIHRETKLSFVGITKIKKIVAAISYVENGIEADESEIDEGLTLLALS